MTEKLFKKGDVIFREGDEGDSLFDISEGTVGIFVNYGAEGEQKLTELKSGQFFGEMAVIEAYPRSATAVALDDVKAFEISCGDMNGYFESQPDRIVAIMKHLSSRIRALSNDYAEVSGAINEFGKSDVQSGSFIDKIKKFANIYKHSKNTANVDSAETRRKISQTSHADGFINKVESYSKGTIIFKEGETGNCMYDIHGGTVGIYKGYGTPEEKRLAELGMNKFFGEMGMVDNDVRSATAVALEDMTTVEIISVDDLTELFTKNAPKVEMILAHMSYRLRTLTNSYMDACKLANDVSDAAASGNVSDELKKKAGSFQPEYYVNI
ncbi:MAG: cyclic nucleotide-binding domain-containing protein [Lachnospiraceae bacterium]|nr:cyclic nucleotide-binding domain-containing protein [Lachnospiraceae bacterium]